MIVFKSISYKNFLSTGNTPTKIFLNRVPSVLITGANGSGKSTMLDAICFALFGKAYRNIKKDQLINTVNAKGMEVEIEFTANEVPMKVVRGIKPNKFQIFRNGVEIPHDAAIKDYQSKLEGIVGLNYRSFVQIVILGSARYQSFMDITTMERRALIEEILDITVFSKMNDVLKVKQQDLELSIKDNEYQRDIINTKISAQKGLIDNIVNRVKESDENIEAEKQRIDAEIVLLEKNIAELDSDLSKMQMPNIEAIGEKISGAKHKESTLKSKEKEILSNIQYYTDNDVCGECTQSIDKDFKQQKVTKLSEEKAKIDSLKPLIEETFNTLQNQFEEAKSVRDRIVEVTDRRKTMTNQISTLKTLKESLKNANQNSDETSLTNAKNDLATFEEEFKTFEKNYLRFTELRHYYEACKMLLKDTGIKAKIIAQYLPVMNKLINKYLDQMGANYSFHLDDQFNETIKSRYRDNFSYASFSEGEKMRIDLSLMFTWREIAKLKNSVNTNLLIMDEIGDSSLDGEATDSLWDILADQKNINAFVISHKTANVERFTSHFSFEKDGNFSKIVDSKV